MTTGDKRADRSHRHRSGYNVHARDRVRYGALRPLATAQQELRQIYPSPGEVEHDPEEIWTTVVATVRAVMARGAHHGKRGRRASVSPISAKPPSSGIAQTGEPIYNAIVWQDRRTADYLRRACGAPVMKPEIAAQDRTSARSLFFREQDRLAARQCDGRARGGRGWQARLRDDRQFPAVAAHRWQGAPDRCHQRGAHAVVRYRQGAMGRRSLPVVWRTASSACRKCAIARRMFGETRPICSAARCAFSALPAINRQRRSGKAASRPA